MEDVGPVNELLDDLLAEKSEVEEKKKKEKEKLNKREEILLVAGKKYGTR